VIGRWTLVTPPTVEPATIEELKAHLYIDHNADDALLAIYLAAARATVEEVTWRAILPQTWDLYLDAWPADGVIVLPRPPLASVTSVTYRDDENVTSTVSASVYEVDTASEPGRVLLAAGQSWPSATLAASGAIRVRFVAGWASAAVVPPMIKAATLLLAGEAYLVREAVSERSLSTSPGVQRLLNLLRVRW
jgi:uncharacterized phiE125 gp8 family phage protein